MPSNHVETPPRLALPAIYSTCPQSRDVPADRYSKLVVETARWSEAAGCEGMLVYADNGIVDPWLVAQLVLQSTDRLAPLVAIQPAYMHPYSAAKMVSTLAYLHDRRVALNMVAGGFRNDLIALSDQTGHEDRYARLIEYSQILLRLLGGETVTFSGSHYAVANLSLKPAMPAELMPNVFISGSSQEGRDAAMQIGAVPVKYPAPVDEESSTLRGTLGVRVGIITRQQGEEAWRVAWEQFPEDRKGQIAHGLAMKVSDSQWHHQLSAMGAADREQGDPYWLWPFENYATFCPYLVGAYSRVAAELRRYIELGASVFILDIPRSEEDLHHIFNAFGLACEEKRPH